MRPAGPFPARPPRSPGAFPPRPHGQIRPPFNGDQRAQTLDSIDSSVFRNGEGNVVHSEEQRAALAAMKNRSYSVTDGQPRGMEERRYSVSSTGSVEENKPHIVQRKPESELLIKPEQRMDQIAESDVFKPNLPRNVESKEDGVKAKTISKTPEPLDAKHEEKPLLKENEKSDHPSPSLNVMAVEDPPKKTAEEEKIPRSQSNESNKNKSEEKPKEIVEATKVIETDKVEDPNKMKAESAKPPKGRNTPDLKIPLKKKSTPKQPG